MRREAFVFSVAVLVIIFLGQVHGLMTFPTSVDVKDHAREQSFIITILNDGPKTEDVTMMVDPYSLYLKEYASITPQEFRIAPNSKRNIEITIAFPDTLSPETHRLRIFPVTKDGKGTAAELIFSVPGEAHHDLSLSDVRAEDVDVDEPVIIDILLNNKGNVIAWATPVIEFRNASGRVGLIESPTVIQIMPRSSYNLSFRHELSGAEPGPYTASVAFSYNGGSLETDSKEARFMVLGSEEEKGSVAWLLPAAGIGAFAIAILAVWAGRKEPSRRSRVRRLEKRIARLEKDISGMVLETDTFVRRANHWLDGRFGEGTYEFR